MRPKLFAGFAGYRAAWLSGDLVAGVMLAAIVLFRLRDILRIARDSRREIQLVIAAALLVVVLPIATGMLLAIILRSRTAFRW